MNINLPRPGEMLRTQQMTPGMLNMPGGPFVGGSQGGPQQQQPSHMGMMPGNPNAANAMGGLLMQSNPSANPNYPLMQQAQQRQFMQQRPHAIQGMNPALGPGPNGLGPNQIPAVNFQNAMMQQNGVRRVQSQPAGLSQTAAQLGGGMPGQQMMPGMNPMAGMGIPGQMRQAMQQGPPGAQMRMQQQHSLPGGMPSEMQMQMARQGGMGGGPGFASHIARTPSQNPSIPSIPQPQSSHPGGMQQASFPAGMTLVGQPMHGQQPQQLRSSPHPVPQGPPGGLQNSMAGASGLQAAASQQRITPDRGMFHFSNPPMQQNMQPGVPRMTPGGVQMGFGAASNAPNPQVGANQQMVDMPQSMSGGNLAGQQRSSSRQGGGGLLVTPVEALQSMNGENFSAPFNMHPQNPAGSAPPRPPSQQRPHYSMPPQQQQQQQPLQPPMGAHRSPRQQDMAHHMQMQRPGSQPQVTPSQSPQRGLSNTPRVPTSQLPQGGVVNNTRTPSLAPAQPTGTAPPPKPPTPAGNAQQVPVTSRPQQLPPNITSQTPQPQMPPLTSGPPSQEAGSSALPPQSHPHPPAQPLMPQRQVPVPYIGNHLVGNGQSLLRLLQFSGVLAGDNAASHNSKLQLCFWEEIIKDYFTTRAVFKFTLWKENQRLEAKPFEIGVPILPRFFLVTAQSGVRCMTLNLDGARERTAGATHAIVECVQAIWTYRYWNGWTITLKGPLTAHIIVVPNVPSVSPTHAPGSYTLKFDQLVFDATTYERLLSFDVLPLHLPLSPASQNTPLPEDEHQPAQNNEVYLVHTEHEDRWQCDNLTFPIPPINGFGIPQATMRCLELAESVVQMSDLIRFSNDKKLGPKAALREFAKQLREQQSQERNNSSGYRLNGPGGPPNRQSPPGMHGGGGMYDHGMNGTSVPASSSSALYPGTPHINHAHPPPLPPQQNGPPGTPKQNKALTPQQTAASASTPSASTPAASTPTPASMTPVTVPQTLKRKAGDSSSPNIANAEQQPQGKRARGKRRGTATS